MLFSLIIARKFVYMPHFSNAQHAAHGKVPLSARRRRHTSIQFVQLQTVRLAQSIPLAQLHRPSTSTTTTTSTAVLFRRQRRLPAILGKVRPAIVHDRAVVVLERIAGVVQRLALKVVAIPRRNVVPVHAHKAIAVGARLLVEQAERVHQFVQRAALVAQTIGAARVRRLQRHDLGAARPSHVRPAAARIANGPDEQVVRGAAVPRDKADAGEHG